MQVNLLSNPECPFVTFLDEGDTHCFEPLSPRGYEVISENHPDFGVRLAEVRHVGFNVLPIRQKLPALPAFIPDVGAGNGKFLTDLHSAFAATTLDRVVSPRTLKVAATVHDIVNLPRSTTILVNGYAEDTFLEKVWDQRYEIASQLARLNAVFTAPDYSVFLDQPHAERLINVKRSLIFFELLQSFGAKAIPTMHWTGLKDLQRWAHWVNTHLSISIMALDLQMLTGHLWLVALNQLRAFSAMLNRRIHFIITGVSSPDKIDQIRSAFKSISVVTAAPIQAAIHHRRLGLTAVDKIARSESVLSPARLVVLNVNLMENVCKRPVNQVTLPFTVPISA